MQNSMVMFTFFLLERKYHQGLIYSLFETGIPILGTPNLEAQIQGRLQKKN